jgi:hypothetical protein
LRYDIGSLDSAGQTRRPVSSGQQSTADVTGLPVGASILYACARDDAGLELCRYQAVDVGPPPVGFDAGSALQDALALELPAEASAAELAGSSQLFAALVSMAVSGDGEASGSVAAAIAEQVRLRRRPRLLPPGSLCTTRCSRARACQPSPSRERLAPSRVRNTPVAPCPSLRAQAGRLIDALVAGVSVDDPEAAQQALASMATVAGAAPELLSESAKEQLAAVVAVGGRLPCWMQHRCGAKPRLQWAGLHPSAQEA